MVVSVLDRVSIPEYNNCYCWQWDLVRENRRSGWEGHCARVQLAGARASAGVEKWLAGAEGTGKIHTATIPPQTLPARCSPAA
jgi:hypothetical protein